MARFDIHRPAVIEPADYEWVCYEYLRVEDLGTAMFLADERARKRAHMERTGGRYATHEHGGNCHVCGAAAIYTALWYHRKTNTYVRTGLDCAEKMGRVDAELFRKKVHAALEARAGKRKAKALLEKAGAGRAWEIVEAMDERRAEYRKVCAAWREANPNPVTRPTADGYGMEEVGAPKFGKEFTYEERTIDDIVMRLIKYGNITDKAMGYLKVLIEKVEKAPAIAAARAAEADAAKPVPVVAGRMKVEGEVLTVKVVDGFYGPTTKMLVRHKDGWKVWVTRPANLDVMRGDTIEFEAKVAVKGDDPKFAIGNRPTKGRIIARMEEDKVTA